jgi:hypothetical protein
MTRVQILFDDVEDRTTVRWCWLNISQSQPYNAARDVGNSDKFELCPQWETQLIVFMRNDRDMS